MGGARDKAVVFHVCHAGGDAGASGVGPALGPRCRHFGRVNALLGLPRGAPSLGDLLNQAKNNLYAPWLGIVGFTVMATMLSLLIFIGEGVRDAFDPRKAL